MPGTEDPVISEIEDLAESYAELRDKRIALLAQEIKIKDQLMQTMKATNKRHYHRDGIDVTIIAESETVKVKVKKADDGTPVELSE